MKVDRRTGREAGPGSRNYQPRSGGRTAVVERKPDAYQPRSGGRTAVVERQPDAPARRRANASHAGASGRREYPTAGSTALRPREDPRVWEGTAERQTPERRAPAPTPAPVPRLKVAPPVPVAIPRMPFIALVLMLVVGGVLGILMVNTKINENAFRLDKLQQQQAALDIQQQQLEKEIALNEAPGNLAARARDAGYEKAGSPQFIRLPDGRVIGNQESGEGEPTGTGQQGPGQ